MGLFLLACAAFISLGLPDAALGVAWPELRATFALPQSAMGAVLAAVSVGYMTSSAAAGSLVPRLGVGLLLPLSTGLVAIGAFGFAIADAFWLVLVAAVVGGVGSGAIDAGLNAFAATNFSARRMNWLHASWGIGAALGPVILTASMAAGGGYRVGYAWVATALVALGLLFVLTRNRWHDARPTTRTVPRVAPGRLRGRALLHVLAFIVYTGVEVGVGQWSFTVLSEQRGLPVAAAGTWTALYWGALCLGRVLVGLIGDAIEPARLVRLGVAGMFAGTLVFALAPMPIAGLALIFAGLAAAPVFPMLMSHTAQVFDADVVPRLVGLQVSGAMLGALLLPTLAGLVADLSTLAYVPMLFVAAAAILATLAWPITRH